MSEQSIEVVRAMMTAFVAGDFEGALAAFDPEVEGDFTHMPDGRMANGREELREEVTRWVRTWESFETEIEDILDAGGEDVVLIVRQTGTGRTSGVPVEIRYGQVFAVRDGAIVSMKSFLDPAAALEAAGLSGGG